MYKKQTSPSKTVENSAMADITESSSSDGSPASIVPSGDVTLDKDVDNKTLKQNLYDLKLRIYYMEQKNKYLEDDDGGDIYQKYVDLQTEFEKLKKNLDEKDELLLKAQKVTLYLRQEKEKTLYEFQEKEKLYTETIQQLEKEVEEMKLRDPKFGLHSATMFMSGGDSADSSSSLCVSSLNKAQHKRISELESQLSQLNMELESVKANNDQLEHAVLNLQRKINLSNKEITELTEELDSLHKERDLYVDNCSKRDEILDKMEKQKQDMIEKLSKVQQENESLRSALTCSVEQTGTSKNDKGTATAVIVQRLLIENKKVNGRLRKVKEDLLQFYEQCSACPHCANEKKLRKAPPPPILNLRSSAATDGTSEDDNEIDDGEGGGGVPESENDGDCEKYANVGENELRAMLRERDELVKQLENELKKRTFNLQELVNKELWDKNREIEKLNKMSEKRKRENDLLRKQLTCNGGGGGGGGGVVGDNHRVVGSSNAMRELQPCSLRNYKIDEKENISVSSMSDDVKLLKEHLRGCLEEKKALLDKINGLERRVATGDDERRSQNSLVRNLRLECAKRKDDFEEAEKARKEAFNACALLTCRLEELACFLESLLAHDGGGGINAKKRQLLKQAIEKSREISKSFSCAYSYVAATTLKSECSSVDLNVPILPDCSEINLSFSGGDDDDDDDDDDDYRYHYDHDHDHDHDSDTVAVVHDRLCERTPPTVTAVVARAFSKQPHKRCASQRSMTKCANFASTEDSDDFRGDGDGDDGGASHGAGVVRRSISFVRHLDAGDELVFSGAVVRKQLANESNADDDNLETTSRMAVAPAPAAAAAFGAGIPEMHNSVTASSAIVSLDEAPKIGDFDSESETWSEPDRNVSAARIGLTSSASKVYVKRPRSEQQQQQQQHQQQRRFNSDSDASSYKSRSAKKYPDAADIRQMQKRIQHLENINESLREELECLRTLPSPFHSCDQSIAAAADKKTDIEKLSEKTKLRNLLNKINLENCVDTSKYRDTVELTRKQLRELSKHLAKTNKLDKFVSLKLKEVCEHFELSELCCSRLHRRLEEAKTRNDVLADLLQETQSKFEQVMTELRATKLAYNGVVLEHEQNIFKYKRCELANEQLKEKLKSADELCRTLEEEARKSGAGAGAGDSRSLRSQLEKASERIGQLELLVATTTGGGGGGNDGDGDDDDAVRDELDRCKRDVEKLGETNERLLRDVEQLDAYKAKIEEYETQLERYRENCERLERELFEKEGVEKLCEEQRVKLTEQLHETDAVNRSLKQADQELREARRQVDRLENEVERLAAELRDAENARVDRDRQISQLKSESARNASLLAEKADVVAQLQKLLEMSDHRTRKFENELRLLRDMLDTCEREKREFRAKIDRQTEQHENLKKQHEQKLKHLLSQIIAHRTEEESSLAAHRELVRQIEQAQNKKQLWKKSIREWKDKYEELKKEKQHVEDRLLRCSGGDDDAAAAVTNQPYRAQQPTSDQSAGAEAETETETENVAESAVECCGGANSDHVVDFKVHHLENIKCQLEARVKELEMANKELEARLRRLQTSKVTPSDFYLSSEEEEAQKQQQQQRQVKEDAVTGATSGHSFANTNNCAWSAAAGEFTYSSCSLPCSPYRNNRACSPSASSVPNSPTWMRKKYSAHCDIGSLWPCENYIDGLIDAMITNDDEDGDKAHPSKVTPTMKHCGQDSAIAIAIATSPDLGIDSDHGRNSSSFEFDSGNGGETKIRCEIINLEEENKNLKRELCQTKKELEETLGKLTTLNKNKKRMEKAIFKQIFETKHILKRARVNLEDAGTDTGVVDAVTDANANAEANADADADAKTADNVA